MHHVEDKTVQNFVLLLHVLILFVLLVLLHVAVVVVVVVIVVLLLYGPFLCKQTLRLRLAEI